MGVKLLSGGTPTPFPNPFSWVEGLGLDTDPSFTAIPAKDVRATNGVGIDYQRVFEPSDDLTYSAVWMVLEYSRHEACNAPDANGNSSRILVLGSDNFWHIYNINLDGNNEVTTVTYDHAIVNPSGITLAEGTWDPVDRDVFTYVGKEATSLVMYEWNCANQTESVRFDWTAQIQARHPSWSDAVGIANIDEGMYSDDGRYAAFLVRAAAFAYRGIVCVDMQTNTILGSIEGGVEPNYITMSPSGDYVSPSWYNTGGPSGTGGAWVYNKDFTNPRRISVANGEHADMVKGADGDDYYVTIGFGDVSQIPGHVGATDWIYAVNCRTQVVTNLYYTYDANVTDAIHFSGRCIGLPGYIVTSHYSLNDRDGIYLTNIHDGTIRRIGYSHVIGAPSYYHQPHAMISPSGKHVFSSTNAEGTSTNPYSIMFHLPIDSIPPAI